MIFGTIRKHLNEILLELAKKEGYVYDHLKRVIYISSSAFRQNTMIQV